MLASSGKVHGAHGGPFPIRLSEMCTPVCNYGATKLFAEGAAQAFATQTGIPTVAIRFAWCPRIMADIEAMKAATTPGNGANEFLSPGDAARCVAAALECSKETLAAASHPPTSAPFAIVFCQSRPLQDGGSRFDMGPTTQLLGFTPSDRLTRASTVSCALLTIQIIQKSIRGDGAPRHQRPRVKDARNRRRQINQTMRWRWWN